MLVNNAGTTSFIPHGDLEKVTDADWERILSVNLKGPFQCVRAAREALDARRRRRGRERLERRGRGRHRQLDPVLRVEGRRSTS